MSTVGERLVSEYFDRLHGYVRTRVPEQDCEDVVGEIFLRAVERQGQLRGDSAAWLFAIARSRVAEFYRKRELIMQTEGLSLSAAPRGQPHGLAGGAAAVAALAPLEQLEQDEFRDRLQRKLEQLPEIEREVIALKFTAGLSNTQIAEILKITPNHLGVVLHRALKKLKEGMSEY